MLTNKKSFPRAAALAALAASAFAATGTTAQARPSNGALIIGGIAAYGVYSASKHHRNDNNRGRYNYGYRGDNYGDRHDNGGYDRRDRYDRHDEGRSYGDPHHNRGGGYGGGYRRRH